MTPAVRTAITPTVAPARAPIDPVYRQIRDLVYKVSGMYKAEEKLYLLADGCARRGPGRSFERIPLGPAESCLPGKVRTMTDSILLIHDDPNVLRSIGARFEEGHPAVLDEVDQGLVGIEDPDTAAGCREAQRQWQSDVPASSDDADIKVSGFLRRHPESLPRRAPPVQAHSLASPRRRAGRTDRTPRNAV